MAHQDRHRRVLKYMARGATEDELAEAGATVAAHYKEVAVVGGDLRQQFDARIAASGLDLLRRDLDAVPR